MLSYACQACFSRYTVVRVSDIHLEKHFICSHYAQPRFDAQNGSLDSWSFAANANLCWLKRLMLVFHLLPPSERFARHGAIPQEHSCNAARDSRSSWHPWPAPIFFLELLPRQQIKLATRLASVIAPHPAGIVPLSGSQASAPCFFLIERTGLLLGLCLLTSARRSFHPWPAPIFFGASSSEWWGPLSLVREGIVWGGGGGLLSVILYGSKTPGAQAP